MGLQASTVWEVQTGGSDNNGGGYTSGGTDYSQQTSPALNPTDLAMSQSSTTLTSATGGFTAAMVGNLIQITAGTNFDVGWYEITGYTDTNTVTLDRTAASGGNGSGGTGYVGGCLATPGQLGKALTDHGVGGMTAHIKSGTYTLSNSSPNTSGGPISLPAVRLRLEGYETARQDRGTKPVIDAGSETGVTIVATQGDRKGDIHLIVNLQVDGNSGANTDGFDGTGGEYRHTIWLACEAVDCPGVGFKEGKPVKCRASGCGSGFVNASSKSFAVGCEAYNCTTGFQGGAHSCIARDNSGDGFYGNENYSVLWDNNTSYNNGGNGFAFSIRDESGAVNCLAVGNGGYGYECLSNGGAVLINCCAYNNTSGATDGHEAVDEERVSITGDPFVDAAGGDFRPNDTAGRGAALRGAGFGAYGQMNNRDIGAVQHTDPAGDGVILSRPRRLVVSAPVIVKPREAVCPTEVIEQTTLITRPRRLAASAPVVVKPRKAVCPTEVIEQTTLITRPRRLAASAPVVVKPRKAVCPTEMIASPPLINRPRRLVVAGRPVLKFHRVAFFGASVNLTTHVISRRRRII